ncbi:MAG: heme-binding protein [Synergistaceae bacterium]|jgi:uncharacterized protein GlcG (DUF336 family)|nr:heme-binding protein [Synergistaceae bacterium]
MVDVITMDQALAAVDASVNKAKSMRVPVVVTVVDAGGHVIVQQRMDKAMLISIRISQKKAETSALSFLTTDSFAPRSTPGAELYGIQESSCGDIIVFGGGFPVRRNGDVIGAIGVSGGSVEEDMAIAKVGLEALESSSSEDAPVKKRPGRKPKVAK